jgi:mRNA interferase YafQ
VAKPCSPRPAALWPSLADKVAYFQTAPNTVPLTAPIVTMRVATLTKRFRRDYAKMKRSGRKIAKLHAVMGLLVDGKPLPPKYRDHSLQGEWQHVRDCHIEGNWVLLYQLVIAADGKETVIFHATDNHENLFG